MHYIVRFLCTLVILFAPLAIKAQLIGGTADYRVATGYSIDGQKDSIFVFNRDTKNPKPHYLKALRPLKWKDSTQVVFDWFKFDSVLADSVRIKYVVDTVSVLNLEPPKYTAMGYGVRISDKDTSYTFRCWVLANDYEFEFTTLDDSGKIKKTEILCGRITRIRAEIKSQKLYYYNLNKASARVFLEKTYKSKTWSNSDGATVDAQEYKTSEWRINKPHYKDSYYILTLKDNYGLERSDSAFYKSIEPHAVLETKYIELTNKDYYPNLGEHVNEYYGRDYQEKSAPALFIFKNKSENTDSIRLNYGDGDSIMVANLDSIPPYTYNYSSGKEKFKPYLIAYRPDNYTGFCYDTTSSDSGFVIEPPKLDTARLPNVFTPNGDGENDYFRFFGDVSIGDFEITVYNRAGHRVFHYQGNIREWDGWDGKKNNSDKVVNSGVYFWVVKTMRLAPERRFKDGQWETLDEDKYFKEKDKDKDKDKDKRATNYYRGFVHVYSD